MTDSQPVLYSFRRCPYAMRARLALHSARISVEHREVLLRDKPTEMLAASPKATVPVLVTPDGSVIDESLEIMFWALDQNDPDAWIPNKVSTRTQMLSLITDNDGPFKQALDQYKYASRFPESDAMQSREAAASFLRRLNDRLERSPCLFGHQTSVADMAIAPFVRQFAMTDLTWFESQNWAALHQWLNSFLESQRFIEIMVRHPRWQPHPIKPGR